VLCTADQKEPKYFCLQHCQKSTHLLLDLEDNNISESLNFIHLVYLASSHYLVKFETPKMQYYSAMLPKKIASNVSQSQLYCNCPVICLILTYFVINVMMLRSDANLV